MKTPVISDRSAALRKLKDALSISRVLSVLSVSWFGRSSVAREDAECMRLDCYRILSKDD